MLTDLSLDNLLSTSVAIFPAAFTKAVAVNEFLSTECAEIFNGVLGY